jgi:FAD/FMN-containing dehydrogenase
MAQQSLEELQSQMRGPVYIADDEHYEAARQIWNTLIYKRPAIIARCSGTADVITAVNFAREHDMPLSVRSGGHDYAGKSIEDESLMIDLSLMNGVRVDPQVKTARVQPGATWGDVDHESQAFGLATPGATVSTVGIAGFTLGGGSGYLSRKYGLGVDNLIAADIVTADGRLLHASNEQNPDLFWAIRGGSGNFGIVTSFELQLHEVGPEVLTAQYFYPLEDGREVFDFYRGFMADAPGELLCYAFVVPIPPAEPFPEELHGKPAVALIGCYCGEHEEGKQILKELENFGDPILGFVQPIAYTQLQKTFDEGVPKGLRWYSKALDFDRLSDGLIEQIISHSQALKGAHTMVYVAPGGGAVNEVDVTATAYPHRDTAYTLHILAGWAEPDKDDEIMDWVNEFYDALESKAKSGVYVNLLGHDETARVPEAYGINYERLQKIKTKWDPDNLFSVNHNIPTAG